MIVYFIIGIIALVVIYAIAQYNSFIKLNNMVKEAFSTMDVYLKKRWDLIPNFVESVKGYMQHEKEVLDGIVNLRNSSYDNMSFSDKIDKNKELSNGLSRLLAVAENYPELKSSQNFSDLTSQLSQIEDEIAKSRKYYNAVVRNLNTKVEMFPSNLIANMFGFKTEKMFEVNEKERNNVKVDF